METTPCPKCGQEIPTDAVDCPYCGIVVAKFRNGPPRRESSGAQDPPSASEPPTTPATSASAATPPPAPAAQEILYDPGAPSPVYTGGGDPDGLVPASPHGPVTDLMVEHLNKTGPWAIFLALLIFLLSIFAGLGALLGGSATGGAGLFARLVSLIVALLYLALALQLFNFGQSARMVGSSVGAKSSTERIEDALRYQRSFWRLSGIVTLALFALLGLVFAFGLLGAMMMRSGGGGP